jgi:tyrosyl-tRNA synthetase
MSKSLGNYVGVNEAPDDMFGKLMGISDPLMERYYLLLLSEDAPKSDPMEAKKQLARRIVGRYHGEEVGNAALENWVNIHQKRDIESANWPVIDLAGVNPDTVSIVVAGYEKGYQITKSRGDARRLVEQGSIQLREEKITDPKHTLTLAAGDVLKLDKKRAVRVG